MTTPDWRAAPQSPARATIFGGGVAGLSVAHELIERGFQVTLWEPAGDPRSATGTCDVGGMARTQWTRHARNWLPGEHGYRFFPSFYNHLFDTMRRTPLPKGRGGHAGATAFDCIRPTTSHAMAFEHASGPWVMSRSRIGSWQEGMDHLRAFFGSRAKGGFELDPRDGTRIAARILQYLTSCDERRAHLEAVSWWDFVEGGSLGANAQRMLERWPEALVGMDARHCDARTYGSTLIPFLLDQARDVGFRDGTLRGPTSEAWLRPWRSYLEQEGVEFNRGRLLGFTVGTNSRGAKCLQALVERAQAGRAIRVKAPSGYIVLALPADEAQRVARSYVETAKRANLNRAPSPISDLSRALEIDTSGAETKPTGTRDFRHFAGIQYYFAEEVWGIDGHVYYPDSDWSLTSVAPTRFWDERPSRRQGFRGILSAIIGAWDVPSRETGRTAWQSTPQQVADEVLRQIRTGLAHVPFPEPIHVHLDDNFRPQTKAKRHAGWVNGSPFPITPAARLNARPGDPRTGYCVEHGIVIAGAYTATFTRIPSMEAANESARHAVNAILRNLSENSVHARVLGATPCALFPLEEQEPRQFLAAKEVDRRLFARGVPNAMDVFGIDKLAATVLRGEAVELFR